MALTKVSYSMISGSPLNVLDFGAVGDGVTDDRAAIQVALNALSVGGKLVFPAGFTFRVVNATGSGFDLVTQRANAVANNTLYALTCSTNDISIVVDGNLVGTSPLDNILVLSGNNVTVSGSGSIRNSSGAFLDTNSSNPLLQWRPSNLVVSGNNCFIHGLRIEDQVTVGIFDQGNYNKIESCTFTGGPTSHGPGTVQFGVQQTVGGQTRFGGMVSNCVFKRSASNGACYTGVISVCRNALITGNTFDALLEHGVYANALDNVISNNIFKNIDTAAAIQSFNGGVIVGNKFIDCGFGSIGVASPNNTVISNNSLVNAGLYGIAIRTGLGDSTSTVYSKLTISNNTIDFVGEQSALDIALEANIQDVTITGNVITNASGDSTYGPVRLDIVPVTSVGRYINFSDNIVKGSNIYGLYMNRFNGGVIQGNTFVNINKTITDVAVRFFNCSNIVFDSNTVHAGPQTNRVLFATGLEGNTQIVATNNNGIGLVGATGAICQVSTDIDSSCYGNGRNSKGTKGTFTPPNVATATVSTGAAGSVRPGGIFFTSLVALTPANSIAEGIQAGPDRIQVTAIADGSFTWATASGAIIGFAGATYMYEIIQ